MRRWSRADRRGWIDSGDATVAQGLNSIQVVDDPPVRTPSVIVATLCVIFIATRMTVVAGDRIVAIVLHFIVIVIGLSALVFTVMTVGAGEDLVVSRIGMTGNAIVSIVPVVSPPQREAGFVIEGRWLPGSIGVTGRAVRAEVITRFIVRMTGDAVGRRTRKNFSMAGDACHLDVRTTQGEPRLLVIEGIRTPVDRRVAVKALGAQLQRHMVGVRVLVVGHVTGVAIGGGFGQHLRSVAGSAFGFDVSTGEDELRQVVIEGCR